MYLFTIRAKPDPDNEDIDDDVGGAYVNVWVNFPEQDAAEVVAKYYISEAGWIPDLTLEIHWVDEEDYEANDEDKDYFMEALQDGSCLVFNQWPKDAEDADTEYDVH